VVGVGDENTFAKSLKKAKPPNKHSNLNIKNYWK